MASSRMSPPAQALSISTVSHVFNHTRSGERRRNPKLLEAVAELNYTPDSVARGLKDELDQDHRRAGDHRCQPLLAEVVQGVEAYCFEQGYT